MKWFYIAMVLLIAIAFGTYTFDDYMVNQCRIAGLETGKLSVAEIRELCQDKRLPAK